MKRLVLVASLSVLALIGPVLAQQNVEITADVFTVEETRSEAVFTTFSSRFNVAAPYPGDQQNNGNTTADRSKPYDHVLASHCLAALQVPTVIGSNQFDAGLVVDTRVYTPISDLSPAVATDSAATAMQHMGVVKDFLIQP